MKRALLLMVVSSLLATLGFAQTPAAGSNTDPANIKGCLGGSDGNYTVVEDGSRQIFKITTSSVDLKPHVGHDVKLIGHKASGAVSSGAADNSFAVTEVSMISEQCAAAAAASVGAVVPYSQTVIEPTTTPAPSASASTPAVDAAAPAATVSPSSATVSTPAAETAAPAATVGPAAAAVSTPAVEAAAPAATVGPAAAAASTPAVEPVAPAATASPAAVPVAEKAAHSTRPSTHRKLAATQDAAVPPTTVSPTAADAVTANPSAETVSPAAADAATASPSSAPVSSPDAAATPPTVTHKTGSLSLLISFVVLVIVLGTMIPFLGRWRKRKMLERTGTPNLSFTKEASSDQNQPEPRKVA